MTETFDFILLSDDELSEINGGSTKAVATIATIGAIGFTIAAAATGNEWCGAAAATCALVAAWCGLAPCI